MSTRVAVALVEHEGHFLVGLRGPSGPLAGYFEFPGGKCHPGESPVECAVRECREETGLDVMVLRLRHETVHEFPHGVIHLHFFDCSVTTPGAVAAPLHGFRWVPRHELPQYRFPEPNWNVIKELSLAS